MYFYNIPEKRWYEHPPDQYYWNDHQWTLYNDFIPLQGSPTLHKLSAVVGTRHPDSQTLGEVKRLFDTTASLENIVDKHSDLYHHIQEHGD